MKYNSYKRNHVIPEGSESKLEEFINQTYPGLGTHKIRNSISSNSEDALTWSLFEVLNKTPFGKRKTALKEIIEDSFEGNLNILEYLDDIEDKFQFDIGKKYQGASQKEFSEIDASLELGNLLIFFEAKLYSPLSSDNTDRKKPYDQIARKMRIGLHNANDNNREFIFIFLDIAPVKALYRKKGKKAAFSKNKKGFYDKWKSAWVFTYYKKGHRGSLTPLEDIFKSRGDSFRNINVTDFKKVSEQMGWLTWADLSKIVLRSII